MKRLFEGARTGLRRVAFRGARDGATPSFTRRGTSKAPPKCAMISRTRSFLVGVNSGLRHGAPETQVAPISTGLSTQRPRSHGAVWAKKREASCWVGALPGGPGHSGRAELTKVVQRPVPAS